MEFRSGYAIGNGREEVFRRGLRDRMTGIGAKKTRRSGFLDGGRNERRSIGSVLGSWG